MDVLVYPGGRGTRAQLGNEAIRARVRTLKEQGTLMTSVCTGALVFADAGLLDERPATTYWSAFDELLPLGRNIEARPDARFVDNGEVITAAGVSAGTDMAPALGRPLAADDATDRLHRCGKLVAPGLHIPGGVAAAKSGASPALSRNCEATRGQARSPALRRTN